ncbi:MAG: class II fructose-bisphosphate aldolase [Clostridia bacterium]|nr:class II fructose-bisphosphate aldolase [Clostridia bacterium]
MSVITERKASLKVFERAAECGTSIGIFCTASYWNTEAILLASQRIAEKYEIEQVPVVIATTFTYPHMPQCERFLYCRDPKAGILSHFGHLQAVAGSKYSPYKNVAVLPHLDHADPERDRWALTCGLDHFSSVMFDAQHHSFEENLELTSRYVKSYGKDVLVEGILESLTVSDGATATHIDNYCENAVRYVKETGVDFAVADLGTEQQSTSVGKATYDKARARELTEALGRKMLVLHGTSCLKAEQIRGLADDGIVRVNMWTRIAREAGQFAAENVASRMDLVRSGDFEATESMQYMRDSVEKAADIMEEMMELFGYAGLAR